ncbi:lipopolysaccharide biosynthesis protein [Acinetobacter beijerinckii]|uniref:lipopolysaccharide biosynthesis protein n=1 Tax=Acinetobacter beijerinckii TaxID=262668 RepID=UPI002407277F|nr:lipopolysaccharide biosynthesis protein [Acinetobacter beijerinckii]
MMHFFSDRVSRSIYKLIYKIFFPKSLKHNRRYWPLYEVKRDEQNRIQKIYYRKKLVSDNLAPNHIVNQKCMLIATGPSIQQLDPEILHRPDIDYIGMNGAITLNSVKFSSYVIIDHNFIDSRFDLVKKVLATNCSLFTTPRCLEIILRLIKFEEIICQIKVIETITDDIVETFLGPAKKFDRNENDFFIYNHLGFSQDIFKGTFDYYTVAYVSLQVAHALNYKQIYLAGLDMNNLSQPRFYENSNCQQPTTLNHHLDAIFKAFDTAAVFLKEKKIQVFNLSQQSAIKSFEKTIYKSNF